MISTLLPVQDASAAEFQIEGFYRARTRLYDTLSLNRDLDRSEGFSWLLQHRMWVRPKFFITDRVALYADVLMFQNVGWGTHQNLWYDPLGLPDQLLLTVEDMPLNDPTVDDDLRFVPLQLWRGWAEFRTPIGTFKVGRQPLDWGMGIWRNDGMGDNDEYGDTADRVSWEHVIQDVWVQAAFNLNTRGLVNDEGAIFSVDVAGAYRSERVEGGLLFQYRRSSFEDAQFNLYTIDGAFDLQFGFIGIDGEVVLQFGNGDLPGGLNDQRIFGAGFALDASVLLDRFDIHLEGGLATGDGDPNDARIRSFFFDRDYNLGLFIFEQPMPVLTSQVPGEARDFSAAQSGGAVHNAGYIRPRVSFRALPGFFIDGQVVAAWPIQVDEDAEALGRDGSYGVEVDLGVRYEAIEHLQIGATLAVFVPGGFYSNIEHDTLTDFGATAVGGQIQVRVRF